MSIVGFNFTKISAERKNAVIGTVNINNNIQLKDASEAKLGLAGERGALRITFTFTSSYTPDLASLYLEGDVIVLVESKQLPKILENWTNLKQLPREIAEPLMNYILEKCNIQALLLAKDLNLPSPVPLPKVQVTMPPDAKTDASADKEIKTTKIKKKS